MGCCARPMPPGERSRRCVGPNDEWGEHHLTTITRDVHWVNIWGASAMMVAQAGNEFHGRIRKPGASGPPSVDHSRPVSGNVFGTQWRAGQGTTWTPCQKAT